MSRVANTPTPFIYRHVLAVMLFAFVFSFPFAFVATLKATVIPVSFMVCVWALCLGRSVSIS